MRLWGGRFGEGPDARMADFTRSIDVDAELALDDIAGSIAHVRGLGRAGLLTEDEVLSLERGLVSLREDVEAGSIAWDPALEDVHLNLETMLTERVGSVGGKLHTGRSRNDQVATDLRLWTRRAIGRLDDGIVGLERALVDLAEREGDAVLPGTTHIQPAQPVLLAHHLLAYVEMLERDRGRLADARRRLNVSPLGAGALAGAGYPLDREATGRDLGFDGVTANSLDATSDRDFVVEVLAAAAPGDGPPVAARGGDHLVVEPAVRVRPGRRRVLHRLLDDAQQEEPGPGGARPRPDGRRDRGRDRHAGAAQGPAARLPARPPGGQARVVRVGRHAGRLARGDGRPRRDAHDRPQADADGGRGGLHDRHRRWPTSWSAAGSRSGPPTTSSAGSWAAPRPRGSAPWPGCRTRRSGRRSTGRTTRWPAGWATDKAMLAALRAAASIEGSLAAADVIGGTAPGRVAEALAAAKERLGA